MSRKQLGGIEITARKEYNIWTLTPIGTKLILARGLSRDDAEEKLKEKLIERQRILVHLREVRAKLWAIDDDNNVELRDFDPIID